MDEVTLQVPRVRTSFQIHRVSKSRGRSFLHYHGDTSSEIREDAALHSDPNPRIVSQNTEKLSKILSWPIRPPCQLPTHQSVYKIRITNSLGSSQDQTNKAAPIKIKRTPTQQNPDVEGQHANVCHAQAQSAGGTSAAPPRSSMPDLLNAQKLEVKQICEGNLTKIRVNSRIKPSFFLEGIKQKPHSRTTQLSIEFQDQETDVEQPIISQKVIPDEHLRNNTSASNSKQKTYLLLGRYLGKGAYSTVYQAADLLLKKQVAVKVIDKKPDQIQGKIPQKVEHEVTCLSSISSPNVVKFHRLAEDKSHVSCC